MLASTIEFANMPRIARPDLIHKAICAGVLRLGQMEWKESAAQNMRNDPRMKGFTTRGVQEELHRFAVANGSGCVEARPETDQYWLDIHPDDPWWYQVVIEADEFPEGLFIKLRLVDPDDEQDPWAQIVSCHPSF
jgi:hypothetical protein